MSFLDRFVTFSPLTENCRRVQDRETGRMALLHWLPASSDLAAALSQAAIVIARGEEAGTIYLVTEDQQELVDLHGWLEKQAKPAAPSEGEFTRLFKTSGSSLPPVDEPPVDDRPQAPAAEGDFTRMFKMQGAPSPVPEERVAPPAALAPPEPVPAKPALDPYARDSRKTFRIPIAPLPPVDKPPPPAESQRTKLYEVPPTPPPDPREFDDFHRSPYGRGADEFENQFAGNVPVQPEAPLPRDPGDFTRLFGRTEAATAPPIEPNTASATGVFAAPKPVESPRHFAPPSQGPGEYTRILQRPAANPVSAPEVAAESRAKPPQSSFLLIGLIVGGLLLIAIVVVVFFAFRH